MVNIPEKQIIFMLGINMQINIWIPFLKELGKNAVLNASVCKGKNKYSLSPMQRSQL